MNQAPAENYAEMGFPVGGLDLIRAYTRQQPRALPNGQYGRTCRDGVNVRGFEKTTLHGRGGSRAGLAKYNAAPVIAGWIVQELALLVATGITPPIGGTVSQLSQSGRVVLVVAVSQGNVYTAQPGATVWTLATNSTGANPPLNYTGLVRSTVLNQKVYFADGTNYVYYDPSDNTVRQWVASAGSLPADSANNFPRLICTWRGRMALSGLFKEPQNVYFSKVSDPTNWDEGDPAAPPDMALALNASPLGRVGQPVACMIPYSDDVLLLGLDHSLWVINGDPMSGGQLDLISDAIGMVWGEPWCRDPYGNVYFFSNKAGVYQFRPGQMPQRLSLPIEQLLLDIDTGLYGVRLFWNDRFQGLHVFVSPLTAAAATTHFFWEQRTGAWWKDVFANTNHDPLCGCVFDGNLSSDRVVLLGSWTGYVYSVSPTAETDDGTAIESYVVIGPLDTKDLDMLLCKDLQAILGTSSGSVTYTVYGGPTAEGALSTTALATGTWSAGRNLTTLIRKSAHNLYVKISSTNAWSLEQIRCRFSTRGKIQRRGR